MYFAQRYLALRRKEQKKFFQLIEIELKFSLKRHTIHITKNTDAIQTLMKYLY